MDDDFAGESTLRPPPPPPDLSAPLGNGRGRPAMTPAQRQLNDQKYQDMQALYEAMPQDARDMQFAIFDARKNVDAKRDPRHLKKIKLSAWKENQMQDPNALMLYLEDKFGPGRYLIEPQDEHGQRILKFPHWVIATDQYDEDDMDDEYDDDRESRRPRRRRSRERERDYDDDDFDDPSDRRENLADGLLMAQRLSTAGTSQAMKQGTDMMTLMMLTSQENQKLAREDAIRREDARAKDEAEARRRDQERKDAEDKRRYDEERKREDDRIRREDERRREDDKKEELRREADRKHERDLAAAQAVSAQKFQALITALPLLLPVAERMFKPAPQAARETDPLTLMITKSFLDEKRNQDPNAAVQAIVEATKLGNQLQTEQMRSAFTMQSELSKVLLTKAIEQAEGGGSGKNMIETITELVTGAAGLAEKLIPAKPAPNPYLQQAQQRVAYQPRPAAQSAPAAPAAPVAQEQAAPTEAQPAGPKQLTEAEMIEANRLLTEAVMKDPTYGTLRALYSIQNKLYGSQQEYQMTIEYGVQCMPLDLRVAVLDNNEARVMELVLPTIQRHPELAEWVQKIEVLTWLREFVPQLAPTIVAIYKATAVEQREQYISLLAQAQAAVQEQPAQPEQPAVVPHEGQPVQVQEIVVEDHSGASMAEVIQGPGSVQEEEAVPAEASESTPVLDMPAQSPEPSGSHLEPDV